MITTHLWCSCYTERGGWGGNLQIVPGRAAVQHQERGGGQRVQVVEVEVGEEVAEEGVGVGESRRIRAPHNVQDEIFHVARIHGGVNEKEAGSSWGVYFLFVLLTHAK